MTRQPRRFTEWEMNQILDVVFLAGYRHEYMMIFKDEDLHQYADWMKADRGLRNRRETGVPLDPQSFRPDGLLLDESGQPFIVETKLGTAVSSEAAHMALVVQALVYANTFLCPSWPNEPPWEPYSFLDYLHQAYWHANRRYSGPCPELRAEHQLHFGLDQPLDPKDFRRIPNVLFLLEHYSDERLRDACAAVRRLDSDGFKELAAGILPKRSQFRKHLDSLGPNWELLQAVEFFVMDVDPSVLKFLVTAHRQIL